MTCLVKINIRMEIFGKEMAIFCDYNAVGYKLRSLIRNSFCHQECSLAKTDKKEVVEPSILIGRKDVRNVVLHRNIGIDCLQCSVKYAFCNFPSAIVHLI